MVKLPKKWTDFTLANNRNTPYARQDIVFGEHFLYKLYMQKVKFHNVSEYTKFFEAKGGEKFGRR